MQPVAVVTGGAVRVGASITRALSCSGFRVVVNYNASADAAQALVADLQASGNAAIAVPADVADRAAVDRLLTATVESYGRIDLLVNNAAVFDEVSFCEIDDELWQRTLRVNLDGPFHMSQAAAPLMLQTGGGRIVNICGTAGITPIRDYAPYCASKAALDMLTRCMAQALAPHIQVNGVAPGTVLFPEETTAEHRRLVVAQIPGGEIGRPQDVADAVRFLARAPDYVTGTIITVDGGASLGSA